jgi:5-methylcytosine-specific restriction endonuclease McrA
MSVLSQDQDLFKVADEIRLGRTSTRNVLWCGAVADQRDAIGFECFYCDARLGDPTRGQVDHFVPWSRYPDNSLDNLVVTDVACNGFKSRSLAATDHVARWARRLVDGSSEHRQFADLVRQTEWERQPDRSAGVARGIYLRLPLDARLWRRRQEFVAPAAAKLAAALTSTSVSPS